MIGPIKFEINHFNNFKKVKEGTTSTLFQAYKNGDTVPLAIKMITHPRRKNVTNSTDIPLEAELLASLGHLNIIRCHGWGIAFKEEISHLELTLSTTKDFVNFIVMEFLDCTTLAEMLSDYVNFTIEQRRDVFKQLINVTQYLQNSGVCHGSITMDNILLEKNDLACIRLVLCDFGDSFHLPPRESLRSNPFDSRPHHDTWQCGSILLSLFWEIPSNYHLLSRYMRGDLFDLVSKLVIFQDTKRESYLHQVLDHPFFSHTIFDKKFTSGTRCFGNFDDYLTQRVLQYMVTTGSSRDISNLTQVCTHFYSLVGSITQTEKSKQRRAIFVERKNESTATIKRRTLEDFYDGVGTVQVDLGDIIALSEGDYKLEAEFMFSFAENYNSHFESMRQRILNFENSPSKVELERQWADILLHAHNICGACGYVGSRRVSYLAFAIRERVRYNTSPMDHKEKELLLDLVGAVQALSVEYFMKAGERLAAISPAC